MAQIFGVIADTTESYLSFNVRFRCINCVARGITNEMDDERRYEKGNRQRRSKGSMEDSMEDNFCAEGQPDLEEELIKNQERMEGISVQFQQPKKKKEQRSHKRRKIDEFFSLESSCIDEEEEEEEEEEGEEEDEEEEEEEEEEKEEEQEEEIGGKRKRKNSAQEEVLEKERHLPYVPDCICFDSLVLRVVDSCKMLPSSLDELATNLRSRVRPSDCILCTTEVICINCQKKEPGEKLFPNTYTYVVENYGAEYMDKFFSKQIFPHDYVTGLESLISTTSLPSKCHFKMGLNSNEEISQQKYDSGLELWNIIKCPNLLNFALEYLKFDILIMSDILECHRRQCLALHQLDSHHFLTSE